MKGTIAGLLMVSLSSAASVGQAAQARDRGSQRQATPDLNRPIQRELQQDLASIEARAIEAEKNGNWEQAAVFQRQASVVARKAGQLQKAVSFGEKALELGEKARNPILQVTAALSLSLAYNTVKQKEKALAILQNGLAIAKQITVVNRRLVLEANLYRDLGGQYLQQGKTQEAIDYIFRSLQAHESFLASVQRRRGRPTRLWMMQRAYAKDLLLLGAAYRKAANPAAAVAAYEKGLSVLNEQRLKVDVEGKLYQELGEIYLNQKNYSRALEYFKRVVDNPQTRKGEQTFLNSASDAGFALLGTGKATEAITYFKRAVESIEASRSSLESEELRSSYFDNKRRVYEGIVSAQLRVGNIDESFNYNERSRSRAFLDILGSKLELPHGALLEEDRYLQARIGILQAKLNDDEEEDWDDDGPQKDQEQLRRELDNARKAYSDFLARVRKENKEQASLMNVEPLTLKEVQERLEPGVTLLEYFVASNAVILWVVEKNKVESIRVALPRKQLLSKVTWFRQVITELQDKDKVDSLSRDLFNLLIQPALSHVHGNELLLIPHDVLHYLPFQALLAPDGRYLIEHFPINYLSSASLMQFTQEKRRAMGEMVLAFGNPELGDPKMALKFAEIEADEIKKLYPQSTVLLEKEATEDKAKTLSPQNDVVHFASHAELNENDPLASAILLAKSDKEDGRLEVREIFGMDLKASLVVLSACETGLGKLSSGDELVGLTRAFIYAGTPSVVASLWNVEDSSTAQLMASFYKNLKTMTKVEALRQAQLNLIRGNATSDFLARRGIGGVGKLGGTPGAKASAQDSVAAPISTSHPYFWAPFILVGEGK